MPDRYFDKFPVITYANTTAVDITKRVAILEKVSGNPYVFYPYDITANERADQLSSRYYEDQYKSWIIYLSNKILDPYYEWCLHENEFNDFLVKKYGSFEASVSKIKYYKNDWFNVPNISKSEYNALPASMRKYWEPVVEDKRVIDYKRKQVNWQSNTNKIVSYTVANGNGFIYDEICKIVFSNGKEGKGQVLKGTNNNLYLRHVSGYYDNSIDTIITPQSFILGSESEKRTAFTDSIVVANNISLEEENYWKAVTYFDYENEINEFNRTIRVIDKRLKQAVVENLKDLMAG